MRTWAHLLYPRVLVSNNYGIFNKYSLGKVNRSFCLVLIHLIIVSILRCSSSYQLFAYFSFLFYLLHIVVICTGPCNCLLTIFQQLSKLLSFVMLWLWYLLWKYLPTTFVCVMRIYHIVELLSFKFTSTLNSIKSHTIEYS